MQILLAVLLVCAGGLEVVELAAATSNHTITKGGVITKPGCESTCGNLTVPFPFGIGLECSINPSFNISCDNTTNPPKASMFIGESEYEVTNISDTELRTSSFVSKRCYADGLDQAAYIGEFLDLTGTPYMFSEVNVLTVVGCDEIGYIYNNIDFYYPKGCITSCYKADKFDCSGTGCCQVPIKARKYVETYVRSFNHTDVSSFNPCGYAFFGDKRKFKFGGASDLIDPTFKKRTEASVPLVLDWVIAENKTCAKAAQDNSSYACVAVNSFCVDILKSRGYRCSCKQGYEGNPYLISGCNDINECEEPSKNGCRNNICTNTIGNYTRSCKNGYIGDGRTCIADRKHNRLSMLLLAI